MATELNRIAVLGNREKPGMQSALHEVEEWARSIGATVETNPARKKPSKSSRSSEGPFGPSSIEQLQQQFAGADLIITLGGDGTLLFSAQVAAPLGIPVLSVNLGSLGFHTQVSPENLRSALQEVAQGSARIENRMLVQAVLQTTDGTEVRRAIALNDVVVSKNAYGHVVHLRVRINGKPATDVSADGLLVATPTGSSAYNYAAGGPVLGPTLDALVLNAICPHRMYFSPIVIPADAELLVEFHPLKSIEEAQFLVDGQPCSTISRDQQLKISKAPMYLPLIVFDDDFYGKLREKLRWGGLL